MTTETKPKVAVLVSGGYHDYLRPKDLIASVNRIQKTFKDCDIYYQTWEDDKDKFKDVDNLIDIDYVPYPPSASYDPYEVVRKNVNEKSWIKLHRFTDVKHPTVKRGVTTGCFQQLSFAIQWSKVPKKYDYYIRCRWDLHICPIFPLDEVLRLCDERIVGISTMPTHDHYKNGIGARLRLAEKQGYDLSSQPQVRQYLFVRVKRRNIRRHIDRGFYCLNSEDTSSEHQVNDCNWDNFLQDFMICFKESDIKDIDIFKLYENEQLMCNEFGWHQIFCSKRSHYNVEGLVGILRNTDHSWETYLKLKEHRLI